MTRLLRAALLAATIALTVPTAASADYTADYTAGWILNPGDKVYVPWPTFNCDASNIEGTYVYAKHTYLSRDPYYRYVLFYYLTQAYQRAVLDLTDYSIENRAPFAIRVWCAWP